MNPLLEKAAEVLKTSKHTTAFTGAGISVESGIPPFRGPEGLWSKYDPKILDINYFFENPQDAWDHIKLLFYDFFGESKPNPAHIALAKLEEVGIIKSVITQNIDNLHQEAGSKTVWEYHGNYRKLICPLCSTKFDSQDFNLKELPKCRHDGSILKPDFVFFGEGIPELAGSSSIHEASIADVFLIIGTTGEIMPASMIPGLAKKNGAKIIEINTETSKYTDDITDIFLLGKAGEIMTEIFEIIVK